MKSRTEILVPIAAIQAVPIAVIAWYRLHRYAWYRYSAIVKHLKTVIEYFKTRKPDFYAEYMADVPIYKSEMEMKRSMLNKGK